MVEPVLKDYGNERDVGAVGYLLLNVAAAGVLSVTRTTSVFIVE